MAAATEGDSLRGLHVLLVEDEPLIADLIQDMLTQLGCEVIGPALSLKQAQLLANGTISIGAALLDVNLGGQQVFPFASTLAARNVPIAFVTGSGSKGLPVEWQTCPTIKKPLDRDQIAAVLRAIAK